MSRTSSIALLFAAGLFAASSVLAAEAPAGKPTIQTGDEAAAKAAPDDVICTYDQVVGSHLKKRRCATRAARDAQAEADQQALKNAQRRGKGYASNKDPAGL